MSGYGYSPTTDAYYRAQGIIRPTPSSSEPPSNNRNNVSSNPLPAAPNQPHSSQHLIIPSSQTDLPASQARAPTEEITLSPHAQYTRGFTPSDLFDFSAAAGEEPAPPYPNIPRPASAPANSSPSRSAAGDQSPQPSTSLQVNTDLPELLRPANASR
ncbi:hypothetical protein BD779DRAFT_1676551 [Infundibulicybe gibba]|nr:hypothetical protein BD779DRAFT_1676551 [Infundibulicybe gibba]